MHRSHLQFGKEGGQAGLQAGVGLAGGVDGGQPLDNAVKEAGQQHRAAVKHGGPLGHGDPGPGREGGCG